MKSTHSKRSSVLLHETAVQHRKRASLLADFLDDSGDEDQGSTKTRRILGTAISAITVANSLATKLFDRAREKTLPNTNSVDEWAFLTETNTASPEEKLATKIAAIMARDDRSAEHIKAAKKLKKAREKKRPIKVLSMREMDLIVRQGTQINLVKNTTQLTGSEKAQAGQLLSGKRGKRRTNPT